MIFYYAVPLPAYRIFIDYQWHVTALRQTNQMLTPSTLKIGAIHEHPQHPPPPPPPPPLCWLCPWWWLGFENTMP